MPVADRREIAGFATLAPPTAEGIPPDGGQAA